MFGKDAIRNRFGQHESNGVTVLKHNRVRESFIMLAEFLDELIPDGDAKDLAFVRLQEASMWSNFAVAENRPLVPKPVRPIPGPPSPRGA